MKICTKCVLNERFPNIYFDEKGVCNFCNEHSQRHNTKVNEFNSKEELIHMLSRFKNFSKNYDVLVPLSGGLDSSVALIEIVQEYGLKPLAFHNDHGFEPDVATNNVRMLCKTLSVDLIVFQHDYNFFKNLWKHVNQTNVRGLNGCFVCGNILYAYAMSFAKLYNIPLIINGYSKGQAELVASDNLNGLTWMSEFIEELTQKNESGFVKEFVGKMSSLKGQRIYKNKIDLEIEPTKEHILVIPFYIFKFYKTDKKELLRICMEYVDWKQADNTYPARTTNCTMNWLNNYFDYKKMGYSNYHAEYSTLIRNNEITREQALLDLNFKPPKYLLEELAKEIDVIL